MIRLSRFILVIACMRYKEYKNTSKILAEYLENIPHIKYEGHGSFTGTTCYIIQNTASYNHILDNIVSSVYGLRVIGYTTYERMPGKSCIVYKKYPFSSSYNSLSMPSHIGISTNDIEKLATSTID